MYCFKLVNLDPARLDKVNWILKSGIINKDVWLAGGSLRTLIDSKDTVCDYDIFFKYDVRQHNTIDAYWHKHLDNVKQVREKLNNLGFKCTFECPEGKLYTYQKVVAEGRGIKEVIKVQLVCEHFYQTPEELLSTFDITPCLFATNGEFLWTYKKALIAVRYKRCAIHKLTYPVATFKRILKYSNKGYNVHWAIEDYVRELSNLVLANGILTSDQMRFYID